jgi:hypothetical protein
MGGLKKCVQDVQYFQYFRARFDGSFRIWNANNLIGSAFFHVKQQSKT